VPSLEPARAKTEPARTGPELAAAGAHAGELAATGARLARLELTRGSSPGRSSPQQELGLRARARLVGARLAWPKLTRADLLCPTTMA
jgi:hypothetical protein